MQTHHERSGGEEKVRQLANRFYGHMDELPEAWDIRKLHGEDLANSRQALYQAFLKVADPMRNQMDRPTGTSMLQAQTSGLHQINP